MAYLSCVSQAFRTNSVPDILSAADEPGASAPINWSVEWLEPYTPPRFQTHQVPSSETLSPVWEAVWKGNLRVCSRRLRSPQPRQVVPNVAVYCASARLHQKSARKSCLIHSRVRMRPRVCAGESGRQSSVFIHKFLYRGKGRARCATDCRDLAVCIEQIVDIGVVFRIVDFRKISVGGADNPVGHL